MLSLIVNFIKQKSCSKDSASILRITKVFRLNFFIFHQDAIFRLLILIIFTHTKSTLVNIKYIIKLNIVIITILINLMPFFLLSQIIYMIFHAKYLRINVKVIILWRIFIFLIEIFILFDLWHRASLSNYSFLKLIELSWFDPKISLFKILILQISKRCICQNIILTIILRSLLVKCLYLRLHLIACLSISLVVGLHLTLKLVIILLVGIDWFVFIFHNLQELRNYRRLLVLRLTNKS